MKFIQRRRRNGFRVSNIRKIVPSRGGGGEARDVCSKEWVEDGFLVAAEGQRDTVVLRGVKVKLAHILVHIFFSRPQGKYLPAGRGGNQAGCNILPRNTIDLRWIDDGAGCAC